MTGSHLVAVIPRPPQRVVLRSPSTGLGPQGVNIQCAKQKVNLEGGPLAENQDVCKSPEPTSLLRHQRKHIKAFMQRISQPQISKGSPLKLTTVLHLCRFLCLGHVLPPSSPGPPNHILPVVSASAGRPLLIKP